MTGKSNKSAKNPFSLGLRTAVTIIDTPQVEFYLKT